MVVYTTVAHGAAQRLSEKWRHFICALLSSFFVHLLVVLLAWHRCRTGSAPVPNRCRTGAAPVPHRCRTGAAPVPPPFRSESARVPANSPEGDTKFGSFSSFLVFFVLLGVYLCFGGVFLPEDAAPHIFRRSARDPHCAPHLLRTCAELVPHLCRTCAALVPHLCRTCAALVPHLCRTLVPHLCRTVGGSAARRPLRRIVRSSVVRAWATCSKTCVHAGGVARGAMRYK